MSETQTYDYSCFFHYRHDYNVSALVQWIRENSEEAVMSLEKVDAVNSDDKHLQVWMRRKEPWTKSDSNFFGVNGKGGKWLVPTKAPNVGEKSGKRWSKTESTITKIEAIQYVLKDKGEHFEHNVELTPQMWEPPARVLELRELRRKKQTQLQNKKAFYRQLLDLWESNGRPNTHRACFEMILKNCVLNKWNYVDGRSVYRMATYIMLRTRNSATVARLMADYDEEKYTL